MKIVALVLSFFLVMVIGAMFFLGFFSLRAVPNMRSALSEPQPIAVARFATHSTSHPFPPNTEIEIRGPEIEIHRFHSKAFFMPGWPEIIIMLVVLGFPVLLLFLLLLFVVRKARGSGAGGCSREEDSRLAQELYDLQKKLEKRVESLETIILDEMKKE